MRSSISKSPHRSERGQRVKLFGQIRTDNYLVVLSFRFLWHPILQGARWGSEAQSSIQPRYISVWFYSYWRYLRTIKYNRFSLSVWVISTGIWTALIITWLYKEQHTIIATESLQTAVIGPSWRALRKVTRVIPQRKIINLHFYRFTPDLGH